MKLSLITPDDDLAIKGVWKDFGPEIDGTQAQLLIAWSGNEAYRRKMARLTRNAAQQMPGSGDIPPETMTKLQRKAMIGTVFLGWRNFENDDGTPIESSDQNGNLNEVNAEALLSNSVVFDFVNLASGRLEEFKRKGEAAEKAAIKSGA